MIFGEIDRLGHVVYHGRQAKYVPSISLSSSDELIEDDVNALHRYWGRCNVFNDLLNLANATFAKEEFRKNQIRTAMQLLDTKEQDACTISEFATSHLSGVGMTISSTPDF
ncbi:MAG: hypothetical protein R3C05_26250 [Pirellulaceae bacterium]